MSSENILRLNQLLDTNGYKASIRTKRDAVYIRGTFLDRDGIRKRKEIALNAKIYDFATCRDRVNNFYIEYEKDKCLPKEFSWNKKTVIKEVKRNTVGKAREQFIKDFWERKGVTEESEQTTESKRTLKSYEVQLNKLDEYKDSTLTPDLLAQVILDKSKANSKPRNDMCKIFKRLGKLYFVENDLKEIDKIRGQWKPNQRQRLNEDEAIELIDKLRENKNYGWLTAAVFIYGCRPMEAFTLNIQKGGSAIAVNCPKAKAKHIKYPVALGIEKDNFNPDPLLDRWDMYNVERIYSWSLEKNDYDSEVCRSKVEAWTKWLRKNGVTNFGLVDLRHYWGIRSIYAEIDIRAAIKSLGHSQQVHTDTYNSTYDLIDAIKQQKKLSK